MSKRSGTPAAEYLRWAEAPNSPSKEYEHIPGGRDEEDLDFERVTKAVPVVTEDVVQALEERIKARILSGQFDDVVRQRPMDDKPFLPSRFFELQDTKSKQSLADIYEDEYVAAQTGGVAGEDRDGKLKKEHDEIQKIVPVITDHLKDERWDVREAAIEAVPALVHVCACHCPSIFDILNCICSQTAR